MEKASGEKEKGGWRRCTRSKKRKKTAKNKIPDPWGGHLVTDDKKRCADRLDWGSWGGREREEGGEEKKKGER